MDNNPYCSSWCRLMENGDDEDNDDESDEEEVAKVLGWL